MFTNRCFTHPLALACVTTALAAAPAPALALPGLNPPAPQSKPEARTGVVREHDTNEHSTLALILAGGALIVAGGGAGFAARDHRPTSQRRLSP
jgi:hypothetical protein